MPKTHPPTQKKGEQKDFSVLPPWYRLQVLMQETRTRIDASSVAKLRRKIWEGRYS